MTAVLLRRSYLVAFHVILGGMLGAGIGLYSVIMYYDMTVR
jgi:LPS O-antigen subunit length determinant protein (WzzB/FepE family)